MTPEQMRDEVLAFTIADVQRMMRFAVDAAIRYEREACAMLFLSLAYDPDYQRLDELSGEYMVDADKIAAAIRART